MYYLIRHYEISSVLEIGFGRGYSTFCMAKAMTDHGIDGKITTIDPNINKESLQELTKIFPRDWFEKIDFINGLSDNYLKEESDKKFDFVYIDGDHKYDSVKKDWDNVKDRFGVAVLFDDYHLPTKSEKDIECAKLIDEIKGYDKQLIVMDRRIFFDDRRISDEDIDYGQVLLTKS
jgi:predicted O-methyltransferase YrrM